VRSASGDDGRKLFQCGAQRARIQGPRCNEPVRQLHLQGAVKSPIHCQRSESVCGISDSTNGPCAGLKQVKGGHAEGRPYQGTVTLDRE
jgi:hypothetical protein